MPLPSRKTASDIFELSRGRRTALHHIDVAISKLTLMKDDIEEAPKLNLIDDIFVQGVNDVIELLASTISAQKSLSDCQSSPEIPQLKDRGRTIPST